MEADQELFAIFRAEVDEQIEDLCDLLNRSPGRWRIDRLFQISHNVKGAARIVGVDPVCEAAHALEDLFSAVRGGLDLSEEAVALVRSGGDLLADCFIAIDEGTSPDVKAYRERVNDCLASAAGVSAEHRPSNTSPADAGQEDPGSETEPSSKMVDASPGEEAPRRDSRATTLRVGTEKVDALLGLASEFVSLVFRSEGHGTTAKRLLSQLESTLRRNVHLRTDPEIREAHRLSRELVRGLADHASDSLRISDEFQASVRALRMVRIEGLRTLLSRSVRDACAQTGRNAKLRVTGGHTEVDRVILDRLRDPLAHLLRNAIAHGIEPEKERIAAGKDGSGVVEVRARSVGPWVEVTVSDDGRGIDVEEVRERALAMGIVTQKDIDDEGESGVLDLLFRSGFSTVESITELAGRGVGLDVVKTQLEQLGGSASIKSELGRGTEVTLRVPLTRLTTKGVLVRVGPQVFAIPSTDVERTLQIQREDVTVADGTEVVVVDGRLVRAASLATILGQAPDESEKKPAVVVRTGMGHRAIIVDEVLGQREFIAGALPWNLKDTKGVAGATVLDGDDVVLILDTRTLVGSHSAAGGWTEVREIHRYRVLVVDDSATSRTLVRNILKTAGYEVLTAIDGEEAFSTLKEQKADLVVSDVEMPKMDGFELTQRIRRDVELERLPVILVTSMGSEEHKSQGAEAGADAYIIKGAFDQDELLQTVARLL